MICKFQLEFRIFSEILSGALDQFANSLSSRHKFAWGIHQDIPKEMYLDTEKNTKEVGISNFEVFLLYLRGKPVY